MAALTRMPKLPLSPIASFSSISRFLCSGAAFAASSGEASPPAASDKPSNARWALVGCQGVGRATYARRLSKILGVPHISVTDLLRRELSEMGPVFLKITRLIEEGDPVPDELVMRLLYKRLQEGREKGESGFLIHGFPYSVEQAELLQGFTDIDLFVNLKLPEHVLVQRGVGVRVCSECEKVFNVTSIDVKEGENGSPAIHIDPVLPPEDCMSKLTTEEDCDEESVKERLHEYQEKRQPVEDFYRLRGKLVDFDLSGGVSQSWPRFLQTLNLNDSEGQDSVEQSAERVCGAPKAN